MKGETTERRPTSTADCVMGKCPTTDLCNYFGQCEALAHREATSAVTSPHAKSAE